jgi:hypothetical protein
MRQFRSSGSVEGVMGNHDSYSDFAASHPLARGRLSKHGFTSMCIETIEILTVFDPV